MKREVIRVGPPSGVFAEGAAKAVGTLRLQRRIGRIDVDVLSGPGRPAPNPNSSPKSPCAPTRR